MFSGVRLGLRYQGIGSYMNLSVFFHQSGMARAGPKSYRGIFASHSSISSLRLRQRKARPTCNDTNNINICLQFFCGEAMAQWENRALIDLRVAGLNPAGQLLIYFHNVFPVLTKTLCRHGSLFPSPHQSFRAQTAALLTPAFGPPGRGKCRII